MAFKTYDQIQIEAKLKACKGCKRQYFFTRHGRKFCMWCRKGSK